MKRSYSLFIKILFFFISCIVISLTLRAMVSYNTMKKEYLDTIHTVYEKDFLKLRDIIAQPLWNINLENVSNILDRELINSDIIYIKVVEKGGGYQSAIMYEKMKTEDHKVIVYDSSIYGSYVLKRRLFDFTGDIIINEKKIGELSVIISTDKISLLFKDILSKTIIDAFTFSLLLLILLLLGIKIIILNPLGKLNKTVRKFANKDFSVRSPVKSHDEIGYLSKTFNYLAETLEDHNQRLLRQIYYDTLTGLPNRAKLLEDLKNINVGLLLLINIDSFQEVNDFYGYEVGDSLLVELSTRLKNVRSDFFVTIYRLQSDEFAVIIMESVESNGTFDEIRGIVSSFVFSNINDKIFIFNESEISIRATVGVAKINNDDNIRALYNADMALKKAKQLQKHYLVYEETLEIAKEYENNIKWTFILKDAITDDRIIPFYQPIVNNQTGLIEKYECLCRLINKNNDIISPYYFLDIAKKTRLYPYITKRIISKAFDRFDSLKYEFSINLSVVDILNDDTRRYIKSVLINNRETAKRVVFEILESEGLQNYTIIKSFIDDVKSLGCKIAIDDFGSGYSNFDHIISLDVDYIKIDASMIKNIDKERESQIITKTIVNFSKELNMKTVSEYVHSLAVFNKVKELGVDFSQGYFFGEPTIDITEIY
ncbi:MAG TPA: diguanylate cyclase [Spirochaetia bacterium]|nr:diguanylate cyclase [Spirochaetia bacterium]